MAHIFFLLVTLFFPQALNFVVVECQDLSIQMLKQASDELMHALDIVPDTANHGHYQSYHDHEVTRPNQMDLLARRLQLKLAAQVQDNWLALTDPQRFAILSSKDPLVQILLSFQPIVKEMEVLEANTESDLLVSQLNSIQIENKDVKWIWIEHWDDLRQYISAINQLYTYFQRFARDPSSGGKGHVDEYVDALVNSKITDNLVTTKLKQFHETVVHVGQNFTLFSLIGHLYMQNDEHLCGMSQSSFQLMYNLYNIIALTELKGYAMLQFAYMTLRINNQGNFTAEAQVARDDFERNSKEKLSSVLEVLPGMSRNFQKCDPKEHKEEQTFLAVKGFLQGYIENEVDMNEGGSCKSKCSEYTYAEPVGCYKDMFCSQQPRCKGRIFDCEFYHADAWVCMSSDPHRRYDWIEYEDGTILGEGNTDQCINKIKVDSWWRYVFWHCSYCFCKCDEITELSERYWSLVGSEADPGYVVTGARIIKRNKVFHIQIQQAKPVLEGGVHEGSKAWKEPAEITAQNLTSSSKVYTMSYEQRAVDLDTLSAPEGYVLTGLKLRNIGGHLNLEIKVNPIKFSTGEVVSEQYLWIGNDNTPASRKPRTRLPIVIPNVPTRLAGRNKVDGSHDMYLYFDTSSALKDVGQTTVPYLDAQPVSPQPATWLAGAGLYHKGRIGYGGFIGISVETYDFSRHMSADRPNLEQLKLEYVKAEGAE
jgi:hypothetical protein